MTDGADSLGGTLDLSGNGSASRFFDEKAVSAARETRSSPPPQHTVTDADWTGIAGQIPGIRGDMDIVGHLFVNALTIDKAGLLYVGGCFTTVGGIPSNMSCITQWNGREWKALGRGIRGSSDNTVVNALAADSAGQLYAGGYFDTAGEATARNIARWNGSVWSAIGNGTEAVSSLATAPDGTVYAGIYGNVVKLSGVVWQKLPGAFDGKITALAFDRAGKLYAGGDFTTINNNACNYIAKWNGSTWSSLGAGMSGSRFTRVEALVVDTSGNLYAGGDFTMAGGAEARYVAKWNGSVWSAVGAGVDTVVEALALGKDGALYAAGGPDERVGDVVTCPVSRWDGNRWSILENRISTYNQSSFIYALALDVQGQLYAGGYFDSADGRTANNISCWNGQNWSPLGRRLLPGSLGSNLAVDRAGNLYACQWGESVGPDGDMIVKWNGNAWSTIVRGRAGNPGSITFDNSDNLFAAGTFSANGSRYFNIGRWDGAGWISVGTVTSFGRIATIKIDKDGMLYAAGSFHAIDGVNVESIAKWDGKTWTGLGDGIICKENTSVYTIAFDSSGNLYAGGLFDTAGGQRVNNIAKWNGSAWSSLGNGVSREVTAIACTRSGNVFVGGYFDSADGVKASKIAMWNGHEWSQLKGGLRTNGGGVGDIDCDASGNLYVAGLFDAADGIPANNIARWDGSVWSALGSGTNKSISSLVLVDGHKLYAGGMFTSAGGKSAADIALCNLGGSTKASSADIRSPRPFFKFNGSSKTLRLDLKNPGIVEWWIHTLTGRLVAVKAVRLTAGYHIKSIEADLRTSGTFVVTVRAGSETGRCIIMVGK